VRKEIKSMNEEKRTKKKNKDTVEIHQISISSVVHTNKKKKNKTKQTERKKKKEN